MLMYYRFCHPSGPIFCCPPDDYPAYQSKGYAEDEEDIEKYTYFEATQPETPPKDLGMKKASNVSMKTSKASLAPRYTSTGQLPRRALLKQITQTNVEFIEVGTPSQLSPIKKFGDSEQHEDQVFTDCTLELDYSLQFQHYTVDASACFQETSKCNTLVYSGVDMSQAGQLDSVCNSTEDEVWKRKSCEIKLERIRHIAQSTPLYAQHPRYRIHREKISCANSNKGGSKCLLGRLQFPKPELEGDKEEHIEPSQPDSTNNDPISSTDSMDSASSTLEIADAPDQHSGKHPNDSGHCTDASSGSDNPPLKGDSVKKVEVCDKRKSLTTDKLAIHPSINSLDKETAIIRDINTM